MSHRRFSVLGVILLALSLTYSVSRADTEVIATIKPIHSLVAAVMDGIGEPLLIVEGSSSVHGYQLKPSQARAFEKAEMVVWISPNFESTLRPAIDNLPQDAVVVELGSAPGMFLLESRPRIHDHGAEESHGDEDEHAGHGHEEHGHDHAEHEDHDKHGDHGHDDHAKHEGHDDHGHEEHGHDHAEHEDHDKHGDHGHDDHDHHDHGKWDLHVWLDLGNAKTMAAVIAEAMTDALPQHEAKIQANLEQLQKKLVAFESELETKASELVGKPYIVFHDAYQYLEERFNLSNVGSVAVNPENPPGVRKIRELQEKVVETQAICAFTEPQFNPRIVEVLQEDTDMRLGQLDPLGAGVEPGPEAYFTILRNLIDSLHDCLT